MTNMLDQATLFFTAQNFLSREAKLLDERRFEEWFELLDDEIIYEVPNREVRLAFSDEVPEGAFRILDNKALIKIRVDRFNSGYCWSESPPSRTLRVIGSLIVNQSGQPDIIEVESAMLLYRQRGTDMPGDVIPVRRLDQLRLTEAGSKLLRRRALIAETVLHTPNLGVFL